MRPIERSSYADGVVVDTRLIQPIERYDCVLQYRLYEIVNWMIAGELLEDNKHPDWIYPVAAVDIRAQFSISVKQLMRQRQETRSVLHLV